MVCWMTLGLTLACAPAALAQSSEYRMDESGNWVEVRSPEAGSDEALIASARKVIAEDRPGEAKGLLDAWIDRNERTQNPWLPEALTLRGDALTAMGEEFDALYDYERVIKEYPASDQYIVCVERELNIGVRYLGGLRRKFLGVRLLPNQDIGQELLIRVQERMPGSRLAERAGIELADYYYANHDLQLASEAYDLFAQNYPNSQYAMKARQRRIYATVGRFKGPKYDGSALLDTKILVRRFANLYPAEAQSAGLDDALLVRLDESSALQLADQAEWYERRDDKVSMRYLLSRLVREHPRTAAAERALVAFEKNNWPLPTGTKAPIRAGTQPATPAPEAEAGAANAEVGK